MNSTLEETAYFLNLTVRLDDIVFAGTGPGSLSSDYQSALRSVPLASRPVLVRSSRIGSGRVTGREKYDRIGMISGDNLRKSDRPLVNADIRRLLLISQHY